ncbi:phosphoenolpyruvate synthase [Patescibacteria group bacterium]|nr:phosphoenolpyruvate synthase [Patescibacteria group bacterium]MBU4098249.1 phosphoenolpyruvate synthase [Patescibacteria group bacterium]
MEHKHQEFILWFNEIGKDDIPLVGGKNANLGEMYQNLTKAKNDTFPHEKIQVPYGFAVTAYSYRYFINENNLDKKIRDILEGLDTNNIRALEKAGLEVRELILSAKFPADLEDAILSAHTRFAKELDLSGMELDVAVRSSATAEDLPSASFAGQQESYLNIRGKHNLLEAIKKAFSSLFTNRAISYRVDQNFDHFKIALSVAVQKMVRSDRGASGVMFTLDTDSGFREIVLINGSWGLGEFVVKGVVTPDEYMVFKPTLKKGYDSIINKKLGSKKKKLIYSHEGTNPTKEAPVHEADRNTFVLNNEQILKLSKWGVIIEDHYKRPMDMEWAYDGLSQELYIVQARPETVQARKDETVLLDYVLEEHGKVLTEGAAVGSKIGQGKARFVKDPSQLNEFRQGEILVAEMTDPDWEPIMKMASAIVTNSGGRTSHAAIVSRELGIAAIVGCGNATEVIPTGTDITVSCAEGERGKVYEGILEYRINKTDIANFQAPKTKIKMIVADPEFVFTNSFIPNQGVGLAREEFIITNFIKIHPNALLNYEKITDKEVKKQIDELTTGYENKVDYYVEKLAFGISIIAAAFYPQPVTLRFSDFKTNEYASLLGGREYEPVEENPMIGWRGASRYYDPNFKDAFALECKAVRIVREKMGLYNLEVMIPFCRTPEEGMRVLEVMEKNGLPHKKVENARHKHNIKSELDEALHVWVMAEIPSNILQIEEFAALFDGFSIGSNDLTQLTLGLDRDSKIVAHIGNERNNSIKSLIRTLIHKAHLLNLPVGICGQGPSDFPDFAEFLVREGIDSISLQPDSVLKTSIRLRELEESLKK